MGRWMYSIETESESARGSTSMHPLWQEYATLLSASLLIPIDHADIPSPSNPQMMGSLTFVRTKRHSTSARTQGSSVSSSRRQRGHLEGEYLRKSNVAIPQYAF